MKRDQYPNHKVKCLEWDSFSNTCTADFPTVCPNFQSCLEVQRINRIAWKGDELNPSSRNYVRR